MLKSFSDRKNRLMKFFSEEILRKDFEKNIKTSDGKNETNAIIKSCPDCNYKASISEFSNNYYVCPKCNYHIRLNTENRIKQLFDENTFEELFENMETPMPTPMFDKLEYGAKLKNAKQSTKLKEAVVCGTGLMDEIKIAAAIMDSHFLMGSMGTVVGDKITRLVEFATERRLPLLIATTSGGARMQEGILSLMQMAKTSAAIKRHSDLGLLYITLLTNPTTGGVSASFAMLGDITAAEPGALIGFAGPRVIEGTIRQQLPEGFQRAEFQLEKGFVDCIVPRQEQRQFFARMIDAHSLGLKEAPKKKKA